MLLGEKLKNRLENLERLAVGVAEQRTASRPQNNVGHQLEAGRHLFPAEETSQSFIPAAQGSNDWENRDPIDFGQPLFEGSVSDLFFGSVPEPDAGALYDESFWLPGDLEYTAPELAQIPGLSLDIPSSEIQVDDQRASSTLNSQQMRSTNTVTENEPLANGFTFDSSVDFELSMSQTTELPRQPTPRPSISTSTALKTSLQRYKDSRKLTALDLDSNDRKQLSKEIIAQLRLEDTKENQCLVSTAIARGHNIRDVFLSGLQALGSSSSLPNAHKNTLTLVRTSTFQAYLTVATAAGIHIPDLYLDSTPSPFYHANVTPTSVPNILTRYTSSPLPSDLRPTAAQILYPHKPWLDLLPFPTLRERALTLSSSAPPMIDLQELKNDIFFNNGLFCWQVSREGRGKGSGHPWDKRSWEAEEWFLKKWWILIGGESADVWLQTKWWRELRGEGRLVLEWGADKNY